MHAAFGRLLATSLLVLLHGGLSSSRYRPQQRLLAMFRPKSKHTALFAPVDGWLLPLDELRHAYGFDVFDRHFNVDRFPEVELRDTFYTLTPRSTTASSDDDDGRQSVLAAAAARCVLLHGLYELWADADSPGRAAEQCAASPGYLRLKGVAGAQMTLAAGVTGQPWLSQADLHAAVLQPFAPLLLDPNDNLTPSPLEASVSVSVCVYVDGGSGRCVAGRVLARGPAAPLAAGQVEPLLRPLFWPLSLGPRISVVVAHPHTAHFPFHTPSPHTCSCRAGATPCPRRGPSAARTPASCARWPRRACPCAAPPPWSPSSPSS